MQLLNFFALPRDLKLLFASRVVRMVSYGCMTVALFPYLYAIGLTGVEVGYLLSFILLGDLCITLYLTTRADSVFGRRNTLLFGTVLKAGAGLVFACSSAAYFWLLVAAGTIGVITSTGGEIGPFLAVEQAAFATVTTAARRALSPAQQSAREAPLLGGSVRPESVPDLPMLLAWYNALGYASLALGTLGGGFIVAVLQNQMLWSAASAYRSLVVLYALFAMVKALCYWGLSEAIEPHNDAQHEQKPHIEEHTEHQSRLLRLTGLHSWESVVVVCRLSALFVIDSFAGGFCMQTFIVQWFADTWQMPPDLLGSMMSAANVLAGISAIMASTCVAWLGAVPTMVYTHLPSNILLLCVPLVNSRNLAVILLLLRFCISQMDVPARQAYVAAVVAPSERSAANGITNTVRSLGLTLSPIPLGMLAAAKVGTWQHAAPLVIAGLLKCVYDIALYSLWLVGGAGRDKIGLQQTGGYAPARLAVQPARDTQLADATVARKQETA